METTITEEKKYTILVWVKNYIANNKSYRRNNEGLREFIQKEEKCITYTKITMKEVHKYFNGWKKNKNLVSFSIYEHADTYYERGKHIKTYQNGKQSN